MSDMDSIVKVEISAETRMPTRAGFSTMLVTGYHTVFPERVRIYESLTGVAEDFPQATHRSIYNSARAAFSQNPCPERVVIGRTALDEPMSIKITPNASDLRANFVYRINIGGKYCTYTSDATPTATEICAGLETAVEALALAESFNITVTNNTSNIVIDAGTVADRIPIGIPHAQRSLLVLKDETADGGAVDDLAAIREENDDWYALVPTNTSQEVLEELAAEMSAMGRLLIAHTSDYDTATTATTDIMSVCKTAGYDHVVIMYLPDSEEYAPAASFSGYVMPQDPGTYTGEFKTLPGVPAEVLTATEKTNIHGKNGLTYTKVGGLGIVQNSKVSLGEWIDTIIGLDWQKARIQESVFGGLANSKKVGFSDNGVGKLTADVQLVLEQGVGTPDAPGLYKADPPPKASFKPVAQVPTVERQAREYKYITFTAELEGAVHYARVAGRVTV